MLQRTAGGPSGTVKDPCSQQAKFPLFQMQMKKRIQFSLFLFTSSVLQYFFCSDFSHFAASVSACASQGREGEKVGLSDGFRERVDWFIYYNIYIFSIGL